MDLLGELSERDLLPVIWFVFSRKGCDQAAARLDRDGVRYTGEDEAARIDEVLEARLAGLDPADLAALGARPWADRLRLGVASHHAGMVPVFKEIVERCFAEGLVRVVFATETLALGVNMPARSVVIDKPTKYDGHRTVPAPCGPVHAVHRPGRTPRHRRGRMGGGALVAGLRLRRYGRDGLEPVLRAALGLPAHLQHGGRPAGSHARRRGSQPDGPILRPAPGRRRVLEVDPPQQFDAVASVLRERGHLDGWTLSASGSLVSHIFHEMDLCVAETLSSGLLDGLSPPELASVMSAFTYEHRSPGPRPEVWIPSGTAYRRLRQVGRTWTI